MSRFSGWRSTPRVILRNSYPSNHEDEDIFPALGERVILNSADFTYQITDGENLVQSHQINHECKHHPGNRRGGKRWSKDYVWWMFCRIHTHTTKVSQCNNGGLYCSCRMMHVSPISPWSPPRQHNPESPTFSGLFDQDEVSWRSSCLPLYFAPPHPLSGRCSASCTVVHSPART